MNAGVLDRVGEYYAADYQDQEHEDRKEENDGYQSEGGHQIHLYGLARTLEATDREHETDVYNHRHGDRLYVHDLDQRLRGKQVEGDNHGYAVVDDKRQKEEDDGYHERLNGVREDAVETRPDSRVARVRSVGRVVPSTASVVQARYGKVRPLLREAGDEKLCRHECGKRHVYLVRQTSEQ